MVLSSFELSHRDIRDNGAPGSYAECYSYEACILATLLSSNRRIGLCGFFNELGEALIMKDLHDWLSRQHHGLRTFQLFRQELETLAAGDPNNRALYKLLSLLASRYIDAFYEEPVPVSIADRAFAGLLEVLDSLDLSKSADGRLSDLNRIAAIDLLAQPPECVGHQAEPSASAPIG